MKTKTVECEKSELQWICDVSPADGVGHQSVVEECVEHKWKRNGVMDGEVVTMDTNTWNGMEVN